MRRGLVLVLVVASACTRRGERSVQTQPVVLLRAVVVESIPDLGCPTRQTPRLHPVLEVFDGEGRSLGLARERATSILSGATCVGDEWLVEFKADDAANRDYGGWCVGYTSVMPSFSGFV